jgi:GNAT superfamily N-acetyltransferase
VWFLQRWFNAPPGKNTAYITDNFGEKFWIYWKAEKFERAAELHIWYRGRPVGTMNFLREKDNSITLADIFIREDSGLRGRGLGKAMLKEFIRWARENHFKRIYGVIEPHDGADRKYLAEWYQQQGFQVKGDQISYELPDE